MEANDLPEYFDAVLSIRFDTEDLINVHIADEAKDNPTVDDLLIAIDSLLYQDFGRQGRLFTVYDDNEEEY